MTQVMLVDAQHAQPPTILGQTPTRFPIGGKIRAGIKVLTHAAERNPTARRLYQEGVASGQSFEAIEAEITKAVAELKHPLVPKNVPYFTVRRADFAMPELAGLILEKYGEDRGDGVRRLYRFPVVFPADTWQAIMPHALMCYGTNQLKYWSEYSPDGRERRCMTFAKVPVDGNGKRAIRLFGGRKHVLRPDNEGRCEPELCREYQSKQCNLSGRFIFLVPGIPSINPIELATNSFYAMNAARQTLETIAFMRGGRISGFLEGRTTFVMTKKLHEVPMIGEDGQPRRVAHWLIEIEAPVDLTRLLRAEEDATTLAQGERAVSVLEGASTAAEAETGELVESTQSAQSEGEVKTAGDGAVASTQTQAPAPAAKPPTGSAETPLRGGNVSAGQGAKHNGNEILSQLLAVVDGLGVPCDMFERYAKKKYGAGWSVNVNGIRRVLAEVEQFRENADAFRVKIESELDVFA